MTNGLILVNSSVAGHLSKNARFVRTECDARRGCLESHGVTIIGWKDRGESCVHKASISRNIQPSRGRLVSKCANKDLIGRRSERIREDLDLSGMFSGAEGDILEKGVFNGRFGATNIRKTVSSIGVEVL